MGKKGDITQRLSRYYTRSEGSVPTFGRSSSSGGESVSLPSIRSTTRQSIRSNRSNMGSRLMLPNEFSTPGPDSYNIRSTIGEGPGAKFKGDRSRAFEQIKSSNATFLLPRLANATPAPGDYNISSSIGRGLKSTFGTSRRDARFAGDRTNNAIFLLQKYDDPSPAPTRYTPRSTNASTSSMMSPSSTMSRGSTFAKAKRDSRFSGDKNAKFLLPKIIQKTPAPTAYKTEKMYSFGKHAKGSSFSRSRRNARFPGDNRALFLLTERLDKFRRPHSYSSYDMNT